MRKFPIMVEPPLSTGAMAWKSCPVSRKRWRRKSVRPSDQMNLPYQLKFPLPHQSSFVPAGLRVFPSVSGRKFPYGEIFCQKNAPKAQGRA
ncbi:hypothetical protein [Bacteroides faecalis]|uniref:hypothetical protein n=1 Tax=Bacteroides faecalis TaxID=2447885 RepID=UPI000F61E8E9|nr:hypothetical protein [Bacteroides faecalis]